MLTDLDQPAIEAPSARIYPNGEPTTHADKPSLGKAHIKRLKTLWELGRPMMLRNLEPIDMDLIAHGLALPDQAQLHSPVAVLTLTREGLDYLIQLRSETALARAGHNDLGSRLAAHLRTKGLMTWENIELSVSEHCSRYVRPDVIACKPALQARLAAPAIYEVKISKADFRSDLANQAKREAYLAIAGSASYCCPEGLIDPTDVPDPFGLIVEKPDGAFETIKRPKRAKNFLVSTETILQLMVKLKAD